MKFKEKFKVIDVCHNGYVTPCSNYYHTYDPQLGSLPLFEVVCQIRKKFRVRTYLGWHENDDPAQWKVFQLIYQHEKVILLEVIYNATPNKTQYKIQHVSRKNIQFFKRHIDKYIRTRVFDI